MKTHPSTRLPKEQGVGLVEVLIGIVISMLLVLMMFQVYLVTEEQKRTITSANDAQENASYGLFLLGQELASAGNIVAVSTPALPTPALSSCAMLRPIPVVIEAGASDNIPDSLTVFYGGSGAMSTPVLLRTKAAVGTPTPEKYQVAGPVGFSPGDAIAVVDDPLLGTNCTLSTINAGGVSVADGIATISHTLTSRPDNNTTATYNDATPAWLVNLGQGDRFARTLYSVDLANTTMKSRSQLPTELAATSVASNVVNLKAQYGLDTDGDGQVDTWQSATGNWSSVNLPLQLSAKAADDKMWFPWQRIQAVRVAIVTRSAQYDRDAVAPGQLKMLDDTVTMDLTNDPCVDPVKNDACALHYRYKVLETIVPLRNAIWNAP